VLKTSGETFDWKKVPWDRLMYPEPTLKLVAVVVLSSSGEQRQTRSSATAERQRISYARLSRLAQ